MINKDYVHLMAAYNRWQNKSLYTAGSSLSDEGRRQDRGAFFGSIHATLSHLVWGDKIWRHRFSGRDAARQGSIPDSVDECDDWNEMHHERKELDSEIIAWARDLDEDFLQGELTWYSGAVGREISKPIGLLVTHFFNHQTHHRGQVHAMLTAAGQRPDDTDLPFMPD